MKNKFLRHTLATIYYRFNKSVKYRDEAFGDFSLGNESRTPVEIINHMYDVFRSTISFIQEGKILKEQPEKLDLDGEIARFNASIKNLDELFESQEFSENASNRLFQGPLSDILTHIGQISMLSRMNNHPIEGEDFSSASIQIETIYNQSI